MFFLAQNRPLWDDNISQDIWHFTVNAKQKKSINTGNNCFLDLCLAHALIHKVDKGYTEVT